MLAGYPPFQDDDPMQIYRKIINVKPKYPDGFDSRLKSLTKHLLRRDLSKRFGNLKDGANDIKNHRFFEEINFEDLVMKKLKAPYVPSTKAMKEKVCDWEKEKITGATAVKTGEDPFKDW
jgi:serine/threonine protein kinase